jgi:hypothetical protein
MAMDAEGVAALLRLPTATSRRWTAPSSTELYDRCPTHELFVETRFYILIKTADKLQENEQN